VLEGNQLGNVSWWVDASFAVHPDMRSHTGVVMSMGGGAAYTMSTRQKINTRSSTEAELVGVDDAMSGIVWTRNFLLAQGFNMTENVVYQDNQSAILLENNGEASSGKRTRHIDIRYFFIKDRIARKELRVEYCPTEEMLSDILTKPLQGSQFRKLRARMLNISNDIGTSSTSPTSQECVETSSRQDDVTDSIHSSESELNLNAQDIEHVDESNDVGKDEWVKVERKKRNKQQKTRSERSHSLLTI
jgi:hypothetical protein